MNTTASTSTSAATQNTLHHAPWLEAQFKQLQTFPGHALLLEGVAGLGQWDLAQALAQAWLCEASAEVKQHGACGQCAGCHAFSIHAHPDLCVLMPEELAIAKQWPLGEREQKDIDDKKRKPSKWIRVEAMRHALAFSQTTNARGERKILMLYPAESMNIESANMLLKTLEEPPGDLRFILATDNAQRLLPTVRSRCQSHHLVWPDAQIGLTWLQAQADTTEKDALACWHISGGCPDEALQWLSLGWSAQHRHQLPKALVKGDWSVMRTLPILRQWRLMQCLCHDWQCVQSGARPRYFEREDLPKPPAASALAAWAKTMLTDTKQIEHPFQANLMQDAWAARLQGLF